MKKVDKVVQFLGLIWVILIFSLIMSGCSNSANTNPPPASPNSTNAVQTANSISPATSHPSTTSLAVQSNSSVSAVSSVQTTKPGEKFDVAIHVKNEHPSRGVQFALSWDPTKVECNSIEQGNYYLSFAQQHEADVFTIPSNNPPVDNSAGKFPKNGNWIAVAIQGAQGPDGSFLGVSGSGDIYILHMTAKVGANGNVDFKLSNVKLVDDSSDINDMHATVSNGKVTITQ